MRQRDELQQQKEATGKLNGRKVTEARASTTDPEARTMKFADGGYRPGYNVQFATDTESGVIVGVEVTNAGNDSEQLPPMLDQLNDRYDRGRMLRWSMADLRRRTRSIRPTTAAAPCMRLSGMRRRIARRGSILMPARRGTAMRSPHGGAAWERKPAS